jgi:hypothetical protein
VTLLVRCADPGESGEIGRNVRRELARSARFEVGPGRELSAVRARGERAPRATVHLAGLGCVLGVVLAGLGVSGGEGSGRARARGRTEP